jgi:hypothetical protein
MNQVLLYILILSVASTAAEPGQWKGLRLDVSTQSDAMAKLGDPERIDHNQKLRTPVDALLDKQHRFERLTFKHGEGFDAAILYFSDDRLKAVLIDLHDKVKASSLSEIYRLDFQLKASVVENRSLPGQFEKHQGKTYPRQFPGTYELIADSGESWVAAQVSNSSFGTVLRQSAGLADDSMGFPGKVYGVWLISKSLRDRSGVEALK